MISDLNQKLQDTYWRVSIKALILDDHDRVLMYRLKTNEWQVPGGGWEHAENLEECIARELSEEVRATVLAVEGVTFCYKGKTAFGEPKINIVVRVTIDDGQLIPSEDDIIQAEYVSKSKFLALEFEAGEETIQDCAHLIWPLL